MTRSSLNRERASLIYIKRNPRRSPRETLHSNLGGNRFPFVAAFFNTVQPTSSMNLSSAYLTEKPVKRLLIIDNSQTFQLSFQRYNLPKLLKLLHISIYSSLRKRVILLSPRIKFRENYNNNRAAFNRKSIFFSPYILR